MNAKTVVMTAAAIAVAVVAPRIVAGAEDEAVVYHDMGGMQKAPYGPYPEERAVMAQTSTLVVFTVPPHFHQPVHHHDAEQVSAAIAGALDYSVGGVVHHLGAHGAVLPASDVEHGFSNDSERPAVMIEYSPLRRPEWVAPHPSVPRLPQSAEPAPLPAGAVAAIDFDRAADGWHVEKSGARSKTITGKTIQATFWDLPRRGASADIAATPSSRERLAFVLEGRLASGAGSTKRDIGPEMLVEIGPSARSAMLSSSGDVPALIVVFEALVH